MSITSVSKSITALLCLVILTHCSTLRQLTGGAEDERIDYKKSATIPTLELPPDLTLATSEQLAIPDATAPTAESATYSGYTHQKQTTQLKQTVAEEGVLPQAKNVELQRSGTARWLVVKNTNANVLWAKLRQFWAEQGFKLTTEDQRIGVMETEWKENRADIPQDALRRLLGGVIDMFYSASTRDRYRTRLERRLETGTLEVYISHRGAEEVTQGDHFVWQPRPVNPELEAELLARLMVFLGVEKEQAKTTVAATQKPTTRAHRAELFTAAGKAPSLLVKRDMDKAWQLVGLALDRVGFVVEDRDVSKGIYFVCYLDPEREGRKSSNFFTRLFSGSDTTNEASEYWVQLTPTQNNTRINVLNKDGKLHGGKTAEKILTMLHEQLK